MEEHFNEDYIESAKYPKSSLKEASTTWARLTLSKDGVYRQCYGQPDDTRVTKAVYRSGEAHRKGGTISASAIFKVSPKITTSPSPAAVRNNIAKEIEITVTCNYEKKASILLPVTRSPRIIHLPAYSFCHIPFASYFCRANRQICLLFGLLINRQLN